MNITDEDLQNILSILNRADTTFKGVTEAKAAIVLEQHIMQELRERQVAAQAAAESKAKAAWEAEMAEQAEAVAVPGEE